MSSLSISIPSDATPTPVRTAPIRSHHIGNRTDASCSSAPASGIQRWRLRPLPPIPSIPSSATSPDTSPVRPLPSIPPLAVLPRRQRTTTTIVTNPDPVSIPCSSTEVTPSSPHPTTSLRNPSSPPPSPAGLPNQHPYIFHYPELPPKSLSLDIPQQQSHSTQCSALEFRSSTLTVPKALLASRLSTASILLSPLSPSIPCMPSPTTAKRKRVDKAQRFLGIHLPGAVISDPGKEPDVFVGDVTNSHPDIHPKWRTHRRHNPRFPGLGKRNQRQKKKVVVSTIDNPGVKEESTIQWPEITPVIEAADSETDDDLWSSGVSSNAQEGTSENPILPSNSSGWLCEKGGQRWVERDFDNVIQTLRSL